MNYHLTFVVTSTYEGGDYTIIANKNNLDLDSVELYRNNINEYGDDAEELIHDVELLNKILDLVE